MPTGGNSKPTVKHNTLSRSADRLALEQANHEVAIADVRWKSGALG
jgi:hypothetical protein